MNAIRLESLIHACMTREIDREILTTLVRSEHALPPSDRTDYLLIEEERFITDHGLNLIHVHVESHAIGLEFDCAESAVIFALTCSQKA
jgi:hypothetical protein